MAVEGDFVPCLIDPNKECGVDCPLREDAREVEKVLSYIRQLVAKFYGQEVEIVEERELGSFSSRSLRGIINQQSAIRMMKQGGGNPTDCTHVKSGAIKVGGRD